VSGPREAASDYLIALADFCSELGGSVMVLGSPAQRMIPEGETRDLAAARFVEAIRPAMERADSLGISLCLEPLPMPDTNFLHSLQEASEVIRLFEEGSARTIFDVKSACSEGIPLPDLIREYAPLIAHVHANDRNLRGPGFGDTDFLPVIRTLQDVGYSGYVSVEVFDYSPDPETIATRSLSYLKSCLR
jgi:sugar phosphate isomerase/epimerase